MRDFNKGIEIIKRDIGEIRSFVLDRPRVYRAFFEESSDQLFYQDSEPLSVLDISKGDYARDFIPKESTYTNIYRVSTSSGSGYEDLDPNFLPFRADSFDLVFCFEFGLGYGRNIYALFELERLLKPGKFLVCGLSSWWYNREFNQFLLLHRAWKLSRAYQILYTYKTGEEELRRSFQAFLVYQNLKK